MAKKRHTSEREFFPKAIDVERILVVKLEDTGKEEIKKRRKARLSSFYAKAGKLVEVTPERIERGDVNIHSKWVKLSKDKRRISFK